MEVLARLLLAGVLAVGVVAKLRDPRASSAAMATFGFESRGAQWTAWGVALATESALAAGVAAGSDRAAYLAAGMMILFAATLGSALLRGRAGAPCACFGGGSTVSGWAIGRNVILAAGFAALPSIPGSLTTDEWLATGLVVALLAVVGLTVAVLALAREVGMLRLRLGPAAALEIAHEGPEVGGGTGLVERFRIEPSTEIALAVFSSEDCHACRGLRPSVELLSREPTLAVEVFDEQRDADVWEAAAIPGAPFAIALERDGTVGAKGTFNNLAQLESIVATAVRRRAERGRLEAVGV